MNEKEISQIIKDFYAQNEWLMSLITDPTGSRYHEEKTKDQRLVEFEEQIERISDFLEFIGNPQNGYKTFHIAGTSGKGSVTAMIAEIFHESGIKSGFHISPYLQLPNEKLVVNNQLIKPSEFCELVEIFKQNYFKYNNAGRKFNTLKYGEGWVVLTYLWMKLAEVDWAVIETGLGGRYDPTNVIDSEIAIITNIDFDHVKSLGPSLEEIAWHKAGIIKEGKVCVTTEKKPEILDVFRKEAERKKAKLYILNEDFSFEVIEENKFGSRINLQGVYDNYNDIYINLPGKFQPVNAAAAIVAVDIAKNKFDLKIDINDVRTALSKIKFNGRIEIIQEDPLVILDGAHNHHKMKWLVESLKESYPDRKKTVVIGALSTKDSAGMVEEVGQIADRWVATQPHVFGKPVTTAKEFAEIIRSVNNSAEIHIEDDVHKALKYAIESAKGNEIVIVTGSIYMLGDARDYWIPRESILMQLEREFSVYSSNIKNEK